MRNATSATLGKRLRHIRASRTQPEMADLLGVAHRTYANYERDERLPDSDVLAKLVGLGWNANWFLTGEGEEQEKSLQNNASQVLRSEELKLAVQLAEEALDGGKLGPDEYAELVTLIYDALVHGLPSAQVIALARPAARGIQGGKQRNVKPAVGGSG